MFLAVSLVPISSILNLYRWSQEGVNTAKRCVNDTIITIKSMNVIKIWNKDVWMFIKYGKQVVAGNITVIHSHKTIESCSIGKEVRNCVSNKLI